MSWNTMLAIMLLIGGTSAWADDSPQADVVFGASEHSFPFESATPVKTKKGSITHKSIQTSIRASATFNIDAQSIERIEYKFRMPEPFVICDYLPTTRVGSETIGQIKIGEKRMKKGLAIVSKGIKGQVGFKIPGGLDAEVGGESSTKDEEETEVGSSIELDKLPPKRLITSVSTQDAGRTLLFKLIRFDQETLEGDKDFVLLAVVPNDWKGDCFTLECTAFLKDSPNAPIKQALIIGLYDLEVPEAKEKIEEKVHRLISELKDARKKPAFMVTSKDIKGKYVCTHENSLAHYTFSEDGTYEISEEFTGTTYNALYTLDLLGRIGGNRENVLTKPKKGNGKWTLANNTLKCTRVETWIDLNKKKQTRSITDLQGEILDFSKGKGAIFIKDFILLKRE